MADKRYKLLKQGLIGSPGFKLGDLEPGDTIEWDGSKWIISPGGGDLEPHSLDFHTDVDLTTNPPDDGERLAYDQVNGQWVPRRSTSSLGIIAFNYRFNVDNSPTQPPNMVAQDNDDSSLVTEIYINRFAQNGDDLSIYLENITTGNWLNLIDRQDSANTHSFDVTGDPVLTGDTFTIPVVVFDNAGPEFSNNEQIAVFIRYAQQEGDSIEEAPIDGTPYERQDAAWVPAGLGPAGPQGPPGEDGATGPTGPEGPGVDPFPYKSDTDPIFLVFTGQSNAGDGVGPTTAPVTPNPRVFDWSAGGAGQAAAHSWISQDPNGTEYPDYTLNVEYTGMLRGSRGHMGWAAADAMQKATGRDVYMVTTHRNGTAIAEWLQGGVMAALTSQRVAEAIATPELANVQTCDAFMWMQGESDGLRTVDEYVTDWNAMRANFENQASGWVKHPRTMWMLMQTGALRDSYFRNCNRFMDVIDRENDEYTRVIRGDRYVAYDNLHYTGDDANAMGYAAGNAIMAQPISKNGSGRKWDYNEIDQSLNTPFNVHVGGNVGIGQTNPQATIDLTPTTGNTGIKLANRDNVGSFYIGCPLTSFSSNINGSYIQIEQAGDGGGNMYFRTQGTGGQGEFEWLGSNGVSRMLLDASGNLGIGTDAPNGKLDISGGGESNPDIRLGTTPNNYTIYRDDILGPLVFDSTQAGASSYKWNLEGSTRMVLTNAGNVGIGIAAPDATLSVRGVSNGLLAKFGGNASVYDRALQISEFDVGGVNNSGFDFNAPHVAAGTLTFSTESTERVRIDAAGNVGIGTAAPANVTNYTSLSLAGPSAGSLDFTDLDGTPRATLFAQSGVLYIRNRGTGHLQFDLGVTPDEKMRITSTGNVGIGTATPNHTLEVAGTIVSNESGVANGAVALGNTAHGIRRGTTYIIGADVNDVDVYTAGAGGVSLSTANHVQGLRLANNGVVSISGLSAGGNVVATAGTGALAIGAAVATQAEVDTLNSQVSALQAALASVNSTGANLQAQVDALEAAFNIHKNAGALTANGHGGP